MSNYPYKHYGRDESIEDVAHYIDFKMAVDTEPDKRGDMTVWVLVTAPWVEVVDTSFKLSVNDVRTLRRLCDTFLASAEAKAAKEA